MADWPVKLDLTPLVTTTSKGLEKLGGLVFGGSLRRDAYKTALMCAQGEADKALILSGHCRFDGRNIVPVLPMPDMPPLSLPLAVEHEQEVHNLAANLRVAQGVLQSTPDDQISDEPVDPDWFARWRREAKSIGNPELQFLWGRVLAEETKLPSRISLRTLDVLKNISQREASLFRQAGKFVISGLLPHSTGGFTLPPPLSDLSVFEDCGLLLSGDRIHSGIDHEGYTFFAWNSFVVRCVIEKRQRMFSTDVCGLNLSQAGLEILSIADIDPPSDEEIKLLFDFTIHTMSKSGDVIRGEAYPRTGEHSYNGEVVLHKFEKK